MSCDISTLKCLNAIYKHIVFRDKERYEPEMYDLFKMAERILDNPMLAAEICQGLCLPVVNDPPPLPIPAYVDMAYFRNYEQDNRLDDTTSTDIKVTAIDPLTGEITVNFIPPDVRLAGTNGQFYVLNRTKYITTANPFEYLQVYAWTFDDFTPNSGDAGGKFTLDFIGIEPYAASGILVTDIFEVDDLIAFINPKTLMLPLYPYAPLIDEEDPT